MKDCKKVFGLVKFSLLRLGTTLYICRILWIGMFGFFSFCLRPFSHWWFGMFGFNARKYSALSNCSLANGRPPFLSLSQPKSSTWQKCVDLKLWPAW